VAAAHQGPQPRRQFVKVEGLAQVVVGTRVEAGDTILDPIPGREYQHRNPIAGSAQATQQIQSREPRQAEVQDHGSIGFGRQGVPGRQAVARPVGAESRLLEAGLDAVSEQRVVFHEKYAHGTSLRESPTGRRRATRRILRVED
jgi:hypothetical protein